jgi:hypothetical protein
VCVGRRRHTQLRGEKCSLHKLRANFNTTYPLVIGINTVTPADAPIKVICGDNAQTVNLLNVTSGE